jgi:hypothetical protein
MVVTLVMECEKHLKLMILQLLLSYFSTMILLKSVVPCDTFFFEMLFR